MIQLKYFNGFVVWGKCATFIGLHSTEGATELLRKIEESQRNHRRLDKQSDTDRVVNAVRLGVAEATCP